ncbi:MAG: M23 family metallopeptidase [Eubacteriales bacterium]|nr:M23 family metallopeptidase [Eubacteriales bacterium]
MSNNKRSGSFGGKGYYIALILCAAAIGITGYLYAKNDNPIQEVSVIETGEEVLAGTTEDVPALATLPQQTTQPAPVPTVPETKPAVKSTLKTMAPVPGDSISGFSVEALSYNQTTRDWRVHNGVDLACEEGEPVAAAAAGEVYTTYEDDALGCTVVIHHQDGYTTHYASLAEKLAVKPGDRVEMGQVIGYASDSAITESTIGAHVHFSVSNAQGAVDPAEFLALGQ